MDKEKIKKEFAECLDLAKEILDERYKPMHDELNGFQINNTYFTWEISAVACEIFRRRTHEVENE